MILEAGRPVLATALRQRSAPQLLLAVLMVVAFGALVAARLSPAPVPLATGSSQGTNAAALTSPAARSPGMASAPSSAVPASPSAVTSPDPSAQASPTVSPVVTLPPTNRTYRVRSGDTLAAIAGHFGTTVKAIIEANHLANPRMIRIGQVLVIP